MTDYFLEDEMEARDEEVCQIAISNLAEKLLDEAIAQGEAFTEGLSNWAISQAEQQLPRALEELAALEGW